MKRVFSGMLLVVIITAIPSCAAKNQSLKALKKSIAQQTQAVKKEAAAALPKQDGIPLVGDLSDADEMALGRETAGRLLAATPPYANDSVQRYINLVGTYVAQQSPRATLAWTFVLVQSDDINAFALPGGYIVLTSGLYAMLENEAELAGVLGHEIAHITLRHHVRLMQKERLVAQGKDMIVSATKQDAIRALAGNGAEICARALDKNAEYECDRLGLGYAARAGYDPYAYLDLLDRLGADGTPDRLALLYSTHPDHRDRLDALDKAIGASWSAVAGRVPARWVAMPR